ncbi:MAG: diguanylate cyclase [Chloroflexi bacterium]|nr:diguanylate cyclase [Chloroflexota bacterium]
MGSFQVSLGDQLLTAAFRTKKERALLAYLAVNAKRYRREVLAELLWPERPEGYARTNLRQALMGIRRALGAEGAQYLKVADDFVELNTKDAWLDAQAFERLYLATQAHPHKSMDTCPDCAQRLRQAVELYRGDFLEDIGVADAQAFQEWGVFHREHYFRYLLAALQTLSDTYQRQDDYERAHQYAWRHVNLAPLEEAAHRQLMNLLAMSGRRSAALEQYQACKRVLAEELNIEPSPETQALYEKIKTGLVLDITPSIIELELTNLPAYLTSFVGREQDVEELEGYLESSDCRLIGIIGMAGVGKTRLALQVAERQIHRFPDGVWFTPLEGVYTAQAMAASIAQAIDLPFDENGDAAGQLARLLRSFKALIVLDNFEQLLGETRFLVEILQQAPGVKFLLTSRERMNYQSACQFDIKGLAYPQDAQATGARNYPAVQLFLARAAHSRSGFTVDEKNLCQILEVCRLVDGLPLGIELAAAGLRDYSLEQIAGGLQQGLGMLMANLQDLPDRHRSLRAAFETSWSRLSKAEQAVFCKVSVFTSEFTLEMAQAVADTLPSTLLALVDKSLITCNIPGRFVLHPLVKRFAAEKLAEDPAEYVRVQELAEQEIRPFATHDLVTGLPNQELFWDRLNHMIARAARSRKAAAVGVLVIEARTAALAGQFQSQLGKLTDCLTSILRRSDTVARLGEREFAFLLEELAQAGDASVVAMKVFDAMNDCAGEEGGYRAYMGISLFPRDGADAQMLYTRAQAAVQRARQSGSQFSVFAAGE